MSYIIEIDLLVLRFHHPTPELQLPVLFSSHHCGFSVPRLLPSDLASNLYSGAATVPFCEVDLDKLMRICSLSG